MRFVISEKWPGGWGEVLLLYQYTRIMSMGSRAPEGSLTYTRHGRAGTAQRGGHGAVCFWPTYKRTSCLYVGSEKEGGGRTLRNDCMRASKLESGSI